MTCANVSDTVTGDTRVVILGRIYGRASVRFFSLFAFTVFVTAGLMC